MIGGWKLSPSALCAFSPPTSVQRREVKSRSGPTGSLGKAIRDAGGDRCRGRPGTARCPRSQLRRCPLSEFRCQWLASHRATGTLPAHPERVRRCHRSAERCCPRRGANPSGLRCRVAVTPPSRFRVGDRAKPTLPCWTSSSGPTDSAQGHLTQSGAIRRALPQAPGSGTSEWRRIVTRSMSSFPARCIANRPE